MSDWKFFVLGRDRTPLPNCSRCSWQSDRVTRHDPEECACLNCHGFYAATNDPIALAEMNRLYPDNAWAVRTGAASGIIVLDFEGPDKDPEGLNTLDRWEEFTGWPLPAAKLIARTPSGGSHLYYAHPGGKITSRNRVLPGLDIKADGGYVVVPHPNTPGRYWQKRGRPEPPYGEFARWLVSTRGSAGGFDRAGRPVGYDYRRFFDDGCPEGAREEFFNDLLFRLRKRGVGRQEAEAIAHFHWTRCAQPPDARWYWAWEHVVYKLNRIWATVEPNELAKWQSDWIASFNERQDTTSTGWPMGKVGRVTII